MILIEVFFSETPGGRKSERNRRADRKQPFLGVIGRHSWYLGKKRSWRRLRQFMDVFFDLNIPFRSDIKISPAQWDRAVSNGLPLDLLSIHA
jgi:hypothetical protein